MPTFTFEKISPPVRRAPVAPPEKKPRGLIVQLLDRLTEARIARRLRKERPAAARRQQETTE